jgi:hypothetical protein
MQMQQAYQGMQQAYQGLSNPGTAGGHMPTSFAVVTPRHDGCMTHGATFTQTYVHTGTLAIQDVLTPEELALLKRRVGDLIEAQAERVSFEAGGLVLVPSPVPDGGSVRLHVGVIFDYSSNRQVGRVTVEVPVSGQAPHLVELPNANDIYERLHALRHQHHNHVLVTSLRAIGFDLSNAHLPEPEAAPAVEQDAADGTPAMDTSRTEREVGKLRAMVNRLTPVEAAVVAVLAVGVGVLPWLPIIQKAFAG